MGYYLKLAKSAIRCPMAPAQGKPRAFSVRAAGKAPCSAIPAGAVLLAPQFDGAGKPLAQVPRCWCCDALWRLDVVVEGKAQAYAFLKPGCGCLAARGCYRCFVCREHCRCAAADTVGTERANTSWCNCMSALSRCESMIYKGRCKVVARTWTQTG
jgi:hypothetical protein